METLRLTNIGKHHLPNIPHDAPLISITDRYSMAPVIPNRDKRPVLFATFFPGDHLTSTERHEGMTPDLARKIVKFVEENRDKKHIFVQCGEGRIRSWTICSVLERMLDFTVHDTERATIKQGMVDKYTHNILMSTIVDMEQAGELL